MQEIALSHRSEWNSSSPGSATVTGDKYPEEDTQVDIQVITGWRMCFILKGHFDLQGQLAPSGVLAGVLPSGQQPNSLLSQDDLSSAVGVVVLGTVGPGGGDTRAFIIIHESF